mmetsp:Transcript_17372/g.40103  ORF Transcript_17372/g.40103 Transcript_17372/m.40103 type:complete len:240 (+) Transcript_17372:286-1005(+)
MKSRSVRRCPAHPETRHRIATQHTQAARPRTSPQSPHRSSPGTPEQETRATGGVAQLPTPLLPPLSASAPHQRSRVAQSPLSKKQAPHNTRSRPAALRQHVCNQIERQQEQHSGSCPSRRGGSAAQCTLHTVHHPHAPESAPQTQPLIQHPATTQYATRTLALRGRAGGGWGKTIGHPSSSAHAEWEGRRGLRAGPNARNGVRGVSTSMRRASVHPAAPAPPPRAGNSAPWQNASSREP